MKQIYLEHFKKFSQEFILSDSGQEIKGLVNAKKRTIEFLGEFIPKEGMLLIHSDTKDHYHLIGNSRKTEVDFEGNSVGYGIQYLSKHEYEAKYLKPTSTFNIGTIQGSAIVGNQHNATISLGITISELEALISTKPEADKAELNKLLQRVEIITEDNQPISKGTLAKFSDILSKHSDVAIAVGSFLTKWLTERN